MSITTGSMVFTFIDTHDNGNLIDGTPGCPHVQIEGDIFRCSPAMSIYVASLAEDKAKEHLRRNSDSIHIDPHYLQADRDSHPHLIAFFDANQPDARYEFLVFKHGLKTDAWYVSTISF